MLFVLIGAVPHTEWLADVLVRDKAGFLITGGDLARGERGWKLARGPREFETNVPGVFAVGDVRAGSVKRVGGAIGEGANVVASIHQYLAAAR